MFDDFFQEADLSRFCSPASIPRSELTEGELQQLEMTEEELQQFEQRVEDWYWYVFAM